MPDSTSETPAQKIYLIYITCPDQTVAKVIARTLLEQGKIACANILPSMLSIYNWDEKVQEDTECVLLLKTQKHWLPMIIEDVKSLHPYDVPCILSWPITAGSPEFLQWIENSTPMS